MENKYSKKQLEELYNCDIFKDFGFDDSHLFWVVQGLPLTENGDDCLFTYADGWDLNELHENMMNKKNSLKFLQSCIDRITNASEEDIEMFRMKYDMYCIEPLK